MNKTLVIFEFRDEVDCFISQRSIDELTDENTYIIAVMPEAQVYLKRMNIRFFNTYDFFGKEGHEQALLQSDNICKFFESLLNIEDDLGIKKGYNISFVYYIRFYIHYLLWLIAVIDRACEHWKVGKIIACYRDYKHKAGPQLSAQLSIDEGCAADIGEMAAKKNGIVFESIWNKKNNGIFEGKIKKHLINFAKFLIIYLNIGSIKMKSKKNKIILATSKNYNLGSVLKQFRNKFGDCRIIYLSNKNASFFEKIFFSDKGDGYLPLPSFLNKQRRRQFLKKLNERISEIEKYPDSDKILAFRDIKFKNIVFHKIKYDLVTILYDIYGQSLFLDKALKSIMPTMVISQMGRGINYNLGELASLNNIPSLLISHGSHVPPKNEYEMIEWKEHGLGLMNTDYEYIAVQSPWAKAYLEKIPSNSKQIITGPLLFSKIDSGKKKQLTQKLISNISNKIILLHADTPRQKIGLRFYVYQTVDEYISSLNSLISSIKRIKNLYLIIRFRPKPYLSKEDLKSLLIEADCYDICTEGTFEEYLSITNMLISYSSTTIEEALQNKVPVLLYDKQGKYCHIPCPVLSPYIRPEISSCYYVDSEDNLPWALNWLVENYFSEKTTDDIWEKHLFSEKGKTNLTSYFNALFDAVAIGHNTIH